MLGTSCCRCPTPRGNEGNLKYMIFGRVEEYGGVFREEYDGKPILATCFQRSKHGGIFGKRERCSGKHI